MNVVISDTTGTSGATLGLVGTHAAPAVSVSAHTSVPEWKSTDTTPRPTGSIWVKTTEPNSGAKWSVKKYNATTQLWSDATAPLYADNHTALFNMDKAGGGANLAAGTTYVQYNVGEVTQTEANFKIMARTASGATTITSSIIAASVPAATHRFDIMESVKGQAALSAAVEVSATYLNDATDAETLWVFALPGFRLIRLIAPPGASFPN